MKCQEWQSATGIRLVRFRKGCYEVQLIDGQVIGEVSRASPHRYRAFDIMNRFIGDYRTRKEAAEMVKGVHYETL